MCGKTTMSRSGKTGKFSIDAGGGRFTLLARTFCVFLSPAKPPFCKQRRPGTVISFGNPRDGDRQGGAFNGCDGALHAGNIRTAKVARG